MALVFSTEHPHPHLLFFPIVEKRINIVRSLVEHLQSVADNKDMLTTRLQKPFVGDTLKVDAAFHQHTSEVFSMLAPILSDLTSHIDDIKWASANTFHQAQLASCLLIVFVNQKFENAAYATIIM